MSRIVTFFLAGIVWCSCSEDPGARNEPVPAATLLGSELSAADALARGGPRGGTVVPSLRDFDEALLGHTEHLGDRLVQKAPALVAGDRQRIVAQRERIDPLRALSELGEDRGDGAGVVAVLRQERDAEGREERAGLGDRKDQPANERDTG